MTELAAELQPESYLSRGSPLSEKLFPGSVRRRVQLPRTGESSSNPQPPTMSDSGPLSINCWILGDHYEHVFTVKISRNENVDDLKDAIKVKKHHSLNDIDADTLILYKVSIEHNPQLAEHVAALELNEDLPPLYKLSEVFANGLPWNHVHVVVETPSGACVYVGLSSLR
jgi:hypothetical protein